MLEKSDKMDLVDLVVRLEATVAKMELITGVNQPTFKDPNRSEHTGNETLKSEEGLPAWLEEYSHFHSDLINPFIGELLSMGYEIKELGKLLMEVFNAHEIILNLAANHGRPIGKDVQIFIKPLIDGIVAVQKFQHSHRASIHHKFFTAISEGIPFLGWIAMETSPVRLYVQQMADSARYFANQVGFESKESWVQSKELIGHIDVHKCTQTWISLIERFAEYVSYHHVSGLQWNAKRPIAKVDTLNSGGTKNKIIDPPSLAGPIEEEMPDFIEVFNELRLQAANLQLRNVTSEMCTHKNSSLRKKGPVNVKQMQKRFESIQTPTGTQPVIELQNKKWVVEYQEDNQQMIIDETNERQSVYMYKCKNSLLRVKGKINTIVLDSCVKCSVVFEDAISICSFVNCESIKAQATGFVPSISIEQTNGLQLYIMETCLMEAQIITAKTSHINICIVREDGDVIETPVKEQFKSVWDGCTLHTVPVDL